MMCSSSASSSRSWLCDYDSIQSVAVILIYIQIACALVGSLGAMLNGVSVVDLAVALFALIAVESSSQSLCRAYAVLLCFVLVLDVAWFVLFARDLWKFAPVIRENYGPLFALSLRLTLFTQIIGFSMRFLSSFLWIQMYRLGVSSVSNSTNSVLRESDNDLRSSLLNSATRGMPRQNSNADEILRASIYDPTYYSPLFEGAQHKRSPGKRDKQVIGYERGAT